MSGPVVLARLVRSGLEESIHLGHAVASDTSGRVIASAGDPNRLVFARSSLKPLQAAVALDALAGRSELGHEDLAIMCGSHNGEEVHVAAVRRLLVLADLDEQALRCPPAWPRFPEDAAGAGGPRAIFHNCSGKHAGMLLASASNGWPTDRYLEPDHPLQSRIREAVTLYADVPGPAEGVDGCGAPVFGVPLRALATLFARVVTGRGADHAGGSGARRAVRAMRMEPYLVAGRDRLDTALMQSVDGIVVKSGAEGLVCAASTTGDVGVAVRVDDGSPRAVAPALIHVLRSLELVRDAHVEALERFARPPVLGGGRPVGHLTSDFTLTAR